MKRSSLKKRRSTPISLATVIILLLVSSAGSAQDNDFESGLALNSKTYSVALGLRAGGTSGITGKFFLSQNSAFEGILSFWEGGLGLTGLYERHVQAFNVAGLNWYYGGGGHGIVATDDIDFGNDRRIARDEFALGVDGIVGLEYKIPPIPFAVSIDLKPNFEVWSGGDLDMHIDPGIGIKLTF